MLNMKVTTLTLQRLIIVAFSVMVIVLALSFRIPTSGTNGYFSLNDIAVIFCGLFLGGTWGGISGAIGCAIADILSGHIMFVPATLAAKGLEGYIAGKLAVKKPLWLIAAILAKVIIYFIAESIMPNIRITDALREIPLNLAQGAIGAIGGLMLYKIAIAVFPNHKQYE